MSRIQIVLVLETGGNDKSDDLYLNAIMRRFFTKTDLNGNEVTIQTIFLKGKRNYASKKVIKQINDYKKCLIAGTKTKVRLL